MAESTDGWKLLARIAAQREAFGSCETTARLAALLLVRTQLVQGVGDKHEFLVLARSIGDEPMAEVLDNLAGYEALRVADNIGWPPASKRTPEAARRWLHACLRNGQDPSDPAPQQNLRRHRAMGATRVRENS